jgi:hypothetical protein
MLRYVFSAQDLFNVGRARADLFGATDVLLYVGFPVQVIVDGEALAMAGGNVREWPGTGAEDYAIYSQGIYRIAGPVNRIELELLSGYGLGVEADNYKRHHHVVIEASHRGIKPELLTPTLANYPCASARVGSGTILALATSGTITLPRDWIEQGGSGLRTPTDIWITHMSALRTTDDPGPSAVPTGSILELSFYRSDIPVGDTQALWRTKGNSPLVVFEPAMPIHVSVKAVQDFFPSAGAGAFQLSFTCDSQAGATYIDILLDFYYRF